MTPLRMYSSLNTEITHHSLICRPEYKRISAFLGDLYFQTPRLYTLSIMSTTQNVWSYREFCPISHYDANRIFFETSLEKRQNSFLELAHSTKVTLRSPMI